MLLAALMAVVFPAIAVAELRAIETRHYRIHTDLSPVLADDLARRMDAMFEEYARRLVSFGSEGARGRVFQVYVVERKSDYLRLTGGEHANSAGMFIPSRNMLAAYLEGNGREELRRTLQHEAFHQFAFTTIGPTLPAWLNEGLAQLFEEGIWTGARFELNELPPRRLARLTADIQARRLVPFDRFLTMSVEQWNRQLGADAERGLTNYNQAWAMVHFLVNATDEKGQPKYRARLIDMLRQIRGGHAPEEAFRLSFGTNVKGFQDRFVEWARSARPTPRASFLENQRVLAAFLVLIDDAGHRFEQMEEFRRVVTFLQSRLQYTQGSMRWSTAEDPEVYFRAPDGRLLAEDELFFSSRAGAPFPDIVCRYENGLQARTQFYFDPFDRKRVQFETLIEAR